MRNFAPGLPSGRPWGAAGFSPCGRGSVNILAHLAFSGDDPEIMAGNLMGDFVKGPLAGRYPPRLTLGLELHRAIDSFANGHESFTRSKRRLAPSFGHYRGVLVDVYYDHFLASEWERYRAEPLQSFITRARAIAIGFASLMPERLVQLLPPMFDEWLPSYAESAGIGRVLRRMSARVGRPNPLALGEGELLRCYRELRGDFLQFHPALTTFVVDFIARRE
ncbi:ACP phosphodiesterase [Geobacter sulfurreducens]|uniref:acyl carrier protein phosphodiesterase n=1 Tax=Geobacter sulfurreducens TaxID=35554 RepID=UPI0001D8F090|nr:ACP phosphodiesterase [Geobacter sulfurreducens]